MGGDGNEGEPTGNEIRNENRKMKAYSYFIYIYMYHVFFEYT